MRGLVTIQDQPQSGWCGMNFIVHLLSSTGATDHAHKVFQPMVAVGYLRPTPPHWTMIDVDPRQGLGRL